MDLSELNKPLGLNEIEFRIQSVNKWWYAKLLVYKDARVDMNRLDKVVWACLWKREHFDNNTKCRVSIYNTDIKEWVSKEDIGTASNTEAEKWLASDSFKRACFNWGIWRELYDYPPIDIKLNSGEFNIKGERAFANTYTLKLNEWNWEVEFEWHKVIKLVWTDTAWQIRFNFPNTAKNNHALQTSTQSVEQNKKFFNYEDLVETVEAWNTTKNSIAKIIIDDWFIVSKNAKVAINHYLETGEIKKDLFFNKN